MANFSFDVIHLCQTILQCPKTTQMQCYAKGIFHLTKNHFDIDCLYHRQGSEQKQVAVHQIKIPINQDTKFIKKISFNFKIFISFQTGFHTYSALSSRLIKETFCTSAVKFPSSLVKRLRRISVETRLKGYKYFEIERDFFNKLGSVHFQEMPGFKGKRKRGLTLTLYKKHFDIDCLYHRQGNEQKQVAVHQI
jgi:hypothetical protein